ncbi:MAG: hypothetical protein JO256_12390 [Alphaproteobacteria bacterium]|nr:hypothetical protein [Alphaproteobacteria bacterium]
MNALLLSLFATTGGLALSGIVANLYRLLARKPKSSPERAFYLGIMALAGPSVLIDNATRSFRRKNCSSVAYLFAICLTLYWSFALGWLLIALRRHL